MKYSLFVLLVLFVVVNSSAQVSNETIRGRIRSIRADNINVTYDEAGRSSKLMSVSENFAKDESSRAGVLAMNFALGCLYPGDSLPNAPETYLFTFWVLTKKPRFGENHAMTVALREEMLVIGSARYTSKPSQQMEYLNFEISREKLSKIAAESDVRFHLGDQVFTFTKSQMKLIADVLAITEVSP